MAGKVIKANKPFEIERLDGDQTVIHFEPRMSQDSNDMNKARLVFYAAIFGGWIPGAVTAADSHAIMFPIVWVTCVVIAFGLLYLARKAQNKRGSVFSTVKLSRDTLETAGARNILDREDIEGFLIQSADTRFTFNDPTSYRIKKAFSDNKAENGFSILAEYGDQKIAVIDHCINERQADKIYTELETWRRDPSHLIGSADAAAA